MSMAAKPHAGGDADYGHTAGFGRRDWAWEFLRRNPDFRTEYQIAGCARWGCLSAASADARAPDALVFWKPELCPDVLRMAAFERRLGLETPPFDLKKVRCRATLLRTLDGKQHLLFQHEGQSLQIAVSGADLSAPVHLLPEAVQRGVDIAHFVHGLKQLQAILEGGRLAPVRTVPSLPRLRVVLQALDGYLAGCPHREIATAIFGERRVSADWNDPGRHLQDQVRRAVRRGRILMEGGYIPLLSGKPIGNK